MMNCTLANRKSILSCHNHGKSAGTMALAVAILVFICSSVFAGPVYPEPTANVNDYVGVLTGTDIENLENLVGAVLDQTGVPIFVAVIETHGDESFEIYAANLYEKWGIGDKNEHKGLLVLVTVSERLVRMEVGYGLEPVITDGRAGESQDKMVPYFKNQEYGKGLYAGLLHAAKYIADDAGIELKIQDGQEYYLPQINGQKENLYPALSVGQILFRVVAVIFLLFAVWLYASRRKNRCPRCKSRLVVTDKVVQQATYSSGGHAVRMFRCHVCGYYRSQPYRTRPMIRPPHSGGRLPPFKGSGRFFGGGFGGSRGRGGSSGPRGLGGGRSGGGGATRKW